MELQIVLERFLHGFVLQQKRSNPSSPLSLEDDPNFCERIFKDSCTTLTLQFLHAIVPFLRKNGTELARLPGGEDVLLSDICSYRINCVDPSVPIFGRISHDVLEVGGRFIDISGAQFRGKGHPLISWFGSARELQASYGGRPLQSFRKLSMEDMTFTWPRFDEEVEREMRQLVGGVVPPKDTCAWCLGAGSKGCAQCDTVVYCGRTCQRLHWKGGHKQACQAK